MKKVLGGAVLGALCVTIVSAGPIVIDEWDSGTDNYAVGGSGYGTLSNPGGYLQVLGGAASFSPEQDTIFDNTGGTIQGYNGGDWTAIESIRFDFFADPGTGVPDGLSIYFTDTDTSATWYYDVAISGTGWTFNRGANLDYNYGWYRTSGTENSATFDAALSGVDEVGFLLTYQFNQGAQTYGFDNLALDNDQFQVPEPETYMVIAFALLSLGITFRRNLNEMLERVGISA